MVTKLIKRPSGGCHSSRCSADLLGSGSTFILGALVLAITFFWQPNGKALSYVLLTLLACLTVSTIVLSATRGRRDWLQLVSVTAITYFLGYVVKGLVVVSGLRTRVWFPPTWIGVTDYDINRALFYALAGFALLLLGYCSPLYRLIVKHLPRFRCNWNGDSLFPRLVLLYVVGLLATILDVWQGGYRGAFRPDEGLLFNIRYAIILAIYLRTCAVFLAWWVLYSNEGMRWRSRLKCFLVIAVGIDVVWALFLSASKSALLRPLTAWLFARHYSGRGLRIGRAMIVLVFGLLVAFPMVNEYRQVVDRKAPYGNLSLREVPEVIREWQASLVNVPVEERVIDALLDIAERLVSLPHLAIVLHYAPEATGFDFSPLLLLLTSPIPRVLWPGKPIPSLGREFAVVYLGQDPRSWNQSAIPQVAELYMAYGIPGVVIGMFVYGVFFRIFYESLVGEVKSPVGALWYYISAMSLGDCEIPTMTNLSALPKTFLLVFLVNRFLALR